MPSSIGNVSQLVAVIRAQLSARTEVASQQSRQTSGKVRSKQNTYNSENLESLIGQRVKNIERDDPNRGRKAFRIFLETILLSHFGEEVINDPKFYQLVDDVQISMEEDDGTSELIQIAIQHLLSADA